MSTMNADDRTPEEQLLWDIFSATPTERVEKAIERLDEVKARHEAHPIMEFLESGELVPSDEMFCITCWDEPWPCPVAAMEAALRAVLELHCPMPVYDLLGDCGHGDTTDCTVLYDQWGDELCGESPTGEVACEWCSTIDSEIAYPCPTVALIEKHLGV